jgi:hypothetical protein
MTAYWSDRDPTASEVVTSVVATGERALGLLAEEAALRRNKARTPAANRSTRAGAKDEAATAVDTASRGQGDRRRRARRGSARDEARRDRAGHGHTRQQEPRGPGTEL